MEDHGEDRMFYQGIIQIAAGYFKLQQGVPVGALKLWRTGLGKDSQPYAPVYFGINVDSLIACRQSHLAELGSDQQRSAPMSL